MFCRLAMIARMCNNTRMKMDEKGRGLRLLAPEMPQRGGSDCDYPRHWHANRCLAKKYTGWWLRRTFDDRFRPPSEPVDSVPRRDTTSILSCSMTEEWPSEDVYTYVCSFTSAPRGSNKRWHVTLHSGMEWNGMEWNLTAFGHSSRLVSAMAKFVMACARPAPVSDEGEVGW